MSELPFSEKGSSFCPEQAPGVSPVANGQLVRDGRTKIRAVIIALEKKPFLGLSGHLILRV
jgi:hypothetical protein